MSPFPVRHEYQKNRIPDLIRGIKQSEKNTHERAWGDKIQGIFNDLW